jgi:hypothetical protein
MQKLLDPKDGLPFINVDGVLRKATTIIEPFPKYTIERVKGGSNK